MPRLCNKHDVCRSVHPSVCPSITLMNYGNVAQPKVEIGMTEYIDLCLDYLRAEADPVKIVRVRKIRSFASKARMSPPPLSSDRQHLSCDVCLEVRGEIIRIVLFCIVY